MNYHIAHVDTTMETADEPPPEPGSRPSAFVQETLFLSNNFHNLSLDYLIVNPKKFYYIHSSSKSISFYQKYFPNTTEREWNSWKWQLQNRITTPERLSEIVSLSDEEAIATKNCDTKLPFAITPYYASLLSSDNPLQPIRRSVIPVADEQIKSCGEADDPLSEDNDSPVHGLVHRYPDRVLFLVTDNCSVFCRYCTRSRLVGHTNLCGTNNWQKAIDYIEAHTEIRDVLLSGGDPLTLTDERINWLLSRIRRIPHVEFIRIGTKVPVVLPQRITPSLTKILKKYHPLFMSIHFTHPEEITSETAQACTRLADAGIPLGSQTVLLKDINDDVETMKKLYHKLLINRVRPYYLYQCDPITGSKHFRTPVSKGIEIIKGLRGHTTGYAVPQYVIDAPGGGGKIPILPEYVLGKEGDDLLLKNYEDRVFKYPDYIKG